MNEFKAQHVLRTLILTVLKDMGLNTIGFHERSKEYIGRADAKEVEVAILLHMNVRKCTS